MADATGLGAKMGMKEVANWDTAFATVDIALPFISETLTRNFERTEDDSLVGSASRGPSQQGNEIGGGDTIHNLDYNNFDSVFKAAFGAAAGRVFTVSDDDVPEVRYVEIERVLERWRYGPMKVSKIVLAGAAGGLVSLSVTWLAKTRTRSGTVHPTLVYGARALVKFSDLVFRIADQGDAMAGGDAYGISSFEFSFDRTMADDDRDTVSGGQILVPIPNDYRKTSMKMTFPRYNATTQQVVAWKEADTPLMIDMVFTLGSETLTLEMPNVRITDGFEPPVDGPGVLKLDGEVTCHPSLAGNPMYVGNEVKATFV